MEENSNTKSIQEHIQHARWFIMLLSAMILVIIALFLSPNHAQAAPNKGFEAVQVVAPKQGVTIPPGESKQLMIGFQNIGTTTWKNSGNAYISIYTQAPKYRKSVFQATSWEDHTQAALLQEPSVAPGEVGHILVTLKAPTTTGTYKETFSLAAEDTAWIPGGQFTLNLTVASAGAPATSTPAQTTPPKTTTSQPATSTSTEGLSALLLLRSAKQITAKAGEEIKYKVGIKNTGTSTWSSREILTNNIVLASSDTEHSSWVSSTKLVSKTDGLIKPGALDFLEFRFNAPTNKGNHTVKYQLAVNDTIVPDFTVEIPVTVTTNAPKILNKPIVIEEEKIPAKNQVQEPILRIGVMIVDEETDWQIEVSCNSAWDLKDSDGGLLGQLQANEMVRAFYKNQRYYFNRGKGIEQTHKYLRFVPRSDDAICTVENFDRRVTRRAAHADNQFRDALEIRYNSANDRTWLINELPIEEYLYGLAETSNISHHEFKKTLLTIARTYATYHWERGTKHADEFFHMNAYADDQVYKGYGHETRHPNVGKAARDTTGITVNYDGKTAITPYFSRSDGRTRDWEEVWGGRVPWVRGVPAPCDAKNGRTLWGHGVGLSASEELCMANEGSNWEEILHYFYTDVELYKRW